ncbi:hypothetical protein DYU05_02600 [Mucilaginibacter terrenus]|uniref:Uncharacterized protein n=2 Tax=Mucilaginibacter terrenus TaxID=2482727 RepID=A0A3E2NU92_9SPHI|nr:hypothetical protein DYU05_02600 [Mucilaginibacter terrenus]
MVIALLLVSCKKENTSPKSETITSGSKWGISIGSSPQEVFAQLQQAGVQYNFNTVAILNRPVYTKPEQIKDLLPLYQSVILQSNASLPAGAYIQFPGDKVTAIVQFPSSNAQETKWPLDVPDDAAIHINDAVTSLYNKLAAIYQVSAYSNYQLVLPDKTLAKPYDTDMANYEEWAFSFSKDVKAGLTGTTSARLIFKNKKLVAIKYDYSENVLAI